jgi:c-di-GMP phosphodiesterase
VAADTMGADSASEYFLLGLCSLLDAMLGQPMETAVAELPLSESVRGALLGNQNQARQVLDSVIAHERGEWEEARRIAAVLSIKPDRLPAAYADSLKWARELTQLAPAA